MGGTGLVGFFKLQEQYPTMRLFTVLLDSTLRRAPVYEQRVIDAYSTAERRGDVADADLFPPSTRTFTHDPSASELAALPVFHDPTRVFDLAPDDDGAFARMRAIRPKKPLPT